MTVLKSWNMRCPVCGDDGHVDIAAITWVRLVTDGTDADESGCGDQEWQDSSAARCWSCDNEGTVAQFAAHLDGPFSEWPRA